MRLVSLIALVLLLAAACGGDDDDGAAGDPPSPTPAAARAGATPTAAPDPTPTGFSPAATSTTPSTATEAPDATPTQVSIPTATRPAPPSTPAQSPPPSSATWTLLEPAGERPEARRDHSFVADDGGQRVYLFGGRSGGVPLDDLWVYDVAGDTWSRLQPGGEPPAARFGHNAAYDPQGGRVLVFGGQAGSIFFSDVWSYDVVTNAWSLLAEDAAGPQTRYGAGGAYDPATGSFLITHGFTSEGRFDDTWSFDPVSASWSEGSPDGGPRPEPRCLLRAFTDPERGRLLLFGGQSNSSPYLGDLWSFDLAAREWRQIEGAGPSPRNFYAAVTSDDHRFALLHGGNAEGTPSDELWLLDFGTDTWTPVAAAGQPGPALEGHDMVFLAGQGALLVFGGDSGQLWRAALA